MLVKDMLNQIEKKEISVKELAEAYGVSTRTIQNKIRKLGYVWSAKKAVYEYYGDEEEPSEMEFASLFPNLFTGKSEREVAATTVRSERKDKPKQIDDEFSIIDEILGAKQEKKDYRGFYLTADVLKVIDSVADKRKKSELVNEALRIVFRNRGLL
ncbi:HTH domain-containing protein [Priestia megaterium]